MDPYDPEPDPRDEDEAYAEHVAACREVCRCCSLCLPCPCDACLAGGVCDAFPCECNEDSDPLEDDS